MFSFLGSDHISGTEALTTHPKNVSYCPFISFATIGWMLLKSFAVSTLLNNPSKWPQIISKISLLWQSFHAFFPQIVTLLKIVILLKYFKYRLLLSRNYNFRMLLKYLSIERYCSAGKQTVLVFPQHLPPKHSPFWQQIINNLTRWWVILEIHPTTPKLTAITLSII